MAAIYRQLRTNLEDRRNRPAARGFYVAEMDSRRWAATEEARTGKPARTEAAVLWTYHLLARYGQSVRLPAIWFALIALLGATGMAIGGVDLTPAFPLTETTVRDGWSWSERYRLVLFMVQSMVSFFFPPNTPNLSDSERTGQLFARFAGPLLFTQLLFALRERVRR
ncbi:MAG: hypothetical protein AAF467_10570 [Actinomycetota bacterium]